MNDNFVKAAKYICDSDAMLITAGAGMGVDSGLPDFRGNEGFWKAYPPIAERGISFYQMANPQWFQNDPELAWAFYGHRLNLYRKTMPHSGFYQILDQARIKRNGYFVFTSNVDGQFHKAGYSDQFIVECHGSIHHLQCCRPCSDKIWSAEDIQIRVNLKKFAAEEPLPSCPDCGSLARPNILMFGDWEWLSQRTNNQNKRLHRWLESLKFNRSKLVIIEIGAGNAVPTVRHLSESVATQLSAKLIRINPRDFDVPAGQVAVKENAAAGIKKIWANF